MYIKYIEKRMYSRTIEFGTCLLPCCWHLLTQWQWRYSDSLWRWLLAATAERSAKALLYACSKLVTDELLESGWRFLLCDWFRSVLLYVCVCEYTVSCAIASWTQTKENRKEYRQELMPARLFSLRKKTCSARLKSCQPIYSGTTGTTP